MKRMKHPTDFSVTNTRRQNEVKRMKKPFMKRTILWSSDATYSNYRIPGMLVTHKGTLLVYCEARREKSDWAMMDILLQRSTDRGESFGEKVVLVKGSEAHPTVNNPVMLQDQNGRLHFLCCEDYTVRGGRILHRTSDDDGVTWSEPRDLTAFAKPAFHNVFALGPGHGITLPDGTLLVPVWMVPKCYEEPLERHSPSVVSTFYSRDNGETWALGDILDITSEVICPNETTAALTSKGEVYLNIRHQAAHRAKAYSATGVSDWRDYGPDRSLWDPKGFGSVVAYDDGVNPYSLIFANCDCKTARKNVTLRVSCDDGKTFPVARVLDAERGGYVEAAADPENRLIYVLYEDNYGETDHFVVLNDAWIFETKEKEAELPSP